ncbi:uncharacterized protein LOC116291927 [Actinia tenebrosa]|uniref:Uncharacterized protein LOC116291927 n=1 Tax=Actinia tenebrosa TaxID=6105 RepID=A0A6P8HGP7_ACTTE|nr:uncharacterized protein LOC116291927 [Actinia tenebrosa]
MRSSELNTILSAYDSCYYEFHADGLPAQESAADSDPIPQSPQSPTDPDPSSLLDKEHIKKLQTILEQVESLREEGCDRVLKFLHSLKDWNSVSECSTILSNEMVPYRAFEIHSKVNDDLVETRCRHWVPDNMLQEGYEPVKVQGDGNCFFRAISTLCSKHKEADWRAIKLGAIIDACANEELYVQQV